MHALKLADTMLFLSTLSLRRATILFLAIFEKSKVSIHALLAESDRFRVVQNTKIDVSIHALLAESDVDKITYQRQVDRFYPRSPCGERPGDRQRT